MILKCNPLCGVYVHPPTAGGVCNSWGAIGKVSNVVGEVTVKLLITKVTLSCDI